MTGCMCIQCREQTALEAVIAKERQADFEHWLARLPTPARRQLPPDHETMLLRTNRRLALVAAGHIVQVVGPCHLAACAGLIAHASGHR